MRSLISAVGLAVALGAMPARAEQEAEQPHGEAKHGEHPHDTPGFIIHHLMDSDEYTFELPVPGLEHQPTLNLGELFSGLRFERSPGACAKEIDKAFAPIPSFGVWMNGCIDLRPTKAVLMMWIASLLLLAFAFAYAPKRKAAGTALVPRGVGQNVLEVLYLYVRDELAVKNIGAKEAARYTPYLATAFFFILFCNWLGLIPNFGTATGQLGVTATLAVMTFCLTQVAGIRAAGVGGYLKHLTGGTPAYLWVIMIPVEILGLFTKPFALMVRLFANMLAGHMALFFILGLIFLISPWVAIGAVPLAGGIYLLELFVGLLQAYIFTMLSAIFIGLSVQMGDHGDGHGHGHAEEHAH
jgi:F-type H+-transporting ATPase subunit a